MSARAPTSFRRPPRSPTPAPVPLRPPRPPPRPPVPPVPRRAARPQADPMNVITDTLRQIFRRKLWPVALLLLGALVAVPLLLAKEPESNTLAAAANAKQVEPLPATFVSAAGSEETAENAK